MVLEGTLFSPKLLDCLPSLLAAASLAVARRAIGSTLWTEELESVTGYTEELIRPVAVDIVSQHNGRRDDLKALHHKWSLPQYGQIANLVLQPF